MLQENSSVKPFSFCYDGEPCDLRTVPCTVETATPERSRIIYEVVPGTIRLILEVIRWNDFPVIEYTPRLENISGSDSGIISDLSVLDFVTEDESYFGTQRIKDRVFPSNSRVTVRYFLGTKAAGTDFLPQRRDLFSRDGCNKLELECSEGRCSADYLPFFGIDSGPENGINLAVGWTGSWKFSLEKEIIYPGMGTGKTSRIRCGMKHASFRLHPGESVMQPGILIHFREGKNIRDAQNEFRRFMIAHHSPRNSRGELIKPPMALAFWGGLETHKLLDRLRIAEEQKLPYDEVWVDAGWMGRPAPCPHFHEESNLESDWPERVGSWEFNTWVHPDGLLPISKKTHENGMRFLVWFESLRIHSSSGSTVITEHPEWLIANKYLVDKGEPFSYLFNIGIPEAREYLFRTICRIMEQEGIDDYREDFNLEPACYFEWNDEPDRIGITEMRFVEGAYLYWEAFRKRFPDMFIDNCASGGRRLDYKTATLSFPLCQSDFATFVGYNEECVQRENLTLDDWIPLHGTLNWGTDDPYHAASAIGCGYANKIWQFNGREPGPDHDFEFHRNLIQWGRELRDLHFAGDVYPLTESPEDDWTKWNGQQVHDPARQYGMVQIFRRTHS